jgi:O-antigen/teichoic acid export membrane protein
MTQAGPGAVDRSQAGRDIIGQLALRIANLALGVFVTLLTVRTLGDAGFGRWSTLLAIVGFVGYLGQLGLNQVALERAAADRAAEGEWIGALVTLRALLSLPVTVLTAAVCVVVADGAAMRLAGVIVCSSLVASALTSVGLVFQLRVRNTVVVAIEVANGVMWAAAVATVALADGGLVMLAIGFVLTSLIATGIQIVLASRVAAVRLRGASRRWPELLRRGLPVGVGGLLVWGYGYVDQVIVFELAGPRDAGLYGAVYRILERLILLPGTLMVTLFPIFVAARDRDRDRVSRVFQLAWDHLLMVSLPALAIAVVGAEPLTRLLFGDEFAAAAPALPVLMGAFVIISLGHLSGYLVIVYGLQRRFIGFALLGLVFNVALNLALVPSYGFRAAAWITVATELLVVGLSMRAVLAASGIRPRLGIATRVVTAGALLAGVGAAARAAGAPLGVWVPVGAGVYGAALLALGALRPADLLDVIRRR